MDDLNKHYLTKGWKVKSLTACSQGDYLFVVLEKRLIDL